MTNLFSAAFRVDRRAALALFALLWATAWIGCDRHRPPRRVMPSDERKMAVDAGQDHLQLALDFIDTFHRYAEREIVPRIHYHLAEWTKTQRPDVDWIADPMFGRLPQRLDRISRAATLSRLEFTDVDILMLREAMWINEVARQVAQRDVSDSRLAAWLNDPHNGLSPTLVRDLRFTIEGFDWVVRNLQLEGTSVGKAVAEASGAEPPGEGIYRMSWEALLIGRGEALTRARIMILLCRQLNIPVVMLGIEPADEVGGGARPWALAALIGNELFLFDPELGLPIPGPGRNGIATLSQVIENPSLLEQLDLDQRKYGVQPADLERIVALVDATIPYLSQRMKLLERRLTGDRKIILSVSPSSLAQELRKCRGVTNVAIWTLPYDVVEYRRRWVQNPELMTRLAAEVQPYSGNTALANGRRLHLAGKYASDPSEKGAKAYYLACRVPDAQIDRPNFDEAMRHVLDLPNVPLPDDPQFMQQFVALQSARLRFFKRHATYWLGLIAFEERKYDVAVDYLKKRTLEANPGGTFEHGARYCLARAYEAQGLRDNDVGLVGQALEIYESDSSPQATGNKLRAKWLRENFGSPRSTAASR